MPHGKTADLGRLLVDFLAATDWDEQFERLMAVTGMLRARGLPDSRDH